MFVGTEKGAIFHHTNIDDNLDGSFEEISDNIILYSKGIRSAPAVYDLNNDGWNDMLLGIYTGGVHLLWGGNTDISIPETASYQIKIYPNPSNRFFEVRGIDSQDIKIQVANASGTLFLEQTSKSIDLSSFSNGLYLVTVIDQKGNTNTQSISLVK